MSTINLQPQSKPQIFARAVLKLLEFCTKHDNHILIKLLYTAGTHEENRYLKLKGKVSHVTSGSRDITLYSCSCR